MMILHCAECDNPLMTTTGRGSYCLHCGFSPSMQDTYFKDIKVTEKNKSLKWNCKDQTPTTIGLLEKNKV